MNKMFICFSMIFFSYSLQAQYLELLTPKLINLGRVQEGDVVKDEIRFVNTWNDPITISGVRSSCGCTATTAKNRECSPGDTATISFSLNTRGFNGLIRKSLTIHFQEKELKDEKFILEAQIYSELSVNPKYIHIKQAKLNPDTVITEFFTIQNESDGPINCNQIYTSNEIAQVFPPSATIPPGKENLIRVELKPMHVGRHTIYVIIVTDNKKKPRINVPIFAHIQK